MKKVVLIILIVFALYACMDVLLRVILFHEPMNVVRSLISALIYCLLFFPAMYFINRKKAADKDQEKRES